MSNANPYSAPQASVSDDYAEFYEPAVFSFSGRIGRLRYLAYSLAWNFAFFGVAFLLGAVVGFIGEGFAILGIILIGIAYVGSIVAVFVLAIRRLNDLNQNGWLSLLMIIPLINILFGLYLVFGPGTNGPNNYGPAPTKNSALVVIGGLAMPFIAILGILAAIALPAYQDYTLRAQTSVGTSEVLPIQTKVEEYYVANGEYPAQNQDINHSWRSTSPYIAAIDVSTGGIITVEYESSDMQIDGKTMVFTPFIDSNQFYWDCTGGDLDSKFRPISCR